MDFQFLVVSTAHFEIPQDVFYASWQIAWSSALDTSSVNVENGLDQLETECVTAADEKLRALLQQAHAMGFSEVVLNLVEEAAAA